jgi:hypothetical protein
VGRVYRGRTRISTRRERRFMRTCSFICSTSGVYTLSHWSLSGVKRCGGTATDRLSCTVPCACARAHTHVRRGTGDGTWASATHHELGGRDGRKAGALEHARRHSVRRCTVPLRQMPLHVGRVDHDLLLLLIDLHRGATWR